MSTKRELPHSRLGEAGLRHVRSPDPRQPARAAFLIKLTATSEYDLALGAATMMLLVLVTILVVPLLLPAPLPDLSVDRGAIAWTLVRQLLLPCCWEQSSRASFPIPAVVRSIGSP